MTATSKSGYVQAEAGPLYYEVAGEGHPLLFIHAGVADHTMWDGQWDLFAQRYRVIRYDTRGFGKTFAEEGKPFSNRQDIYDLLRHLGVASAYIIGLSRGAQIALDFTLEHPEMVDALVWVAGGVSGSEIMPTDEEMAFFMGLEEIWKSGDFAKLADMESRVWVDGPGQPENRADPSLREQIREMIFNNLTNHTVEGVPDVLDPPAAGRLDEIKVPLLVMVGDLDTSNTVVTAEVLTQSVPGAKKVVFSGVAHMVNMEKPEEFNRLVLDFLDEAGR